MFSLGGWYADQAHGHQMRGRPAVGRPPGTSAIAVRFLLSAFALIHVLAAAFVALLAAAAPLLGAAALLLAATALLCAAALLALLAALIALVRAALALIVPSTLILIRHGVLL
jgi:hypothetical protein